MLPGLSAVMMMAGAGVPVPTIVGVEGATIGATSHLVINKPAGVQSGDHLIAVVWATVAGSLSMTGWTSVASDYNGTIRFEVFRKVAGGSEPADYTVTQFTGNKSGFIIALRGGSGLIDVVGSKTEATSTNTATAPSITPSHAGVLFSAFAINSALRTISAGPSGMTQQSVSGLTGVAFSSALYSLSPSGAGATGAKVATWSGAAGTTDGLLLQAY